MRFSLSTYSLHRLSDEGKTLSDIIKITAELGYEGIEFVEFDAPEGMTELEYASSLKLECAAAGLKVVCYTVSADFINGSGGDTSLEVERVKKKVDVAAALGAPLMRHDMTWSVRESPFRTFDEALPTLAEAARAVTDYAESLSVRTMTENHGFLCQESTRLERLLTAVGRRNFGILLDIGNFLCADERPECAVGRLCEYAFHVHAKDFCVKSGDAPMYAPGFFKSRGGAYLKGVILGHGDVPVYRCLSALLASGYDGFVSLEFEGLEEPKLAAEYSLTALRRMLSDLESSQ